MKPGATSAAPQTGELLRRIFAGLFGGFLGLSLLKFGNPPIMEKFVSAPDDVYEFLLGFPWPMGWAYRLLALVAVAGLFNARVKRGAPWRLVALPMAWLIWQVVAGIRTVDDQLTTATLQHFVACVVCFYLGFFSLSAGKSLWPFWLGLLSGFLVVLAVGWEQHLGGLEETRRYFFMYLYPQHKEMPPEFLKKMSSNRIFSSLFYPNALAGAILLLLPPTLAVVWQMRRRLTRSARVFLVNLIGIAALLCLYWSGSKGGWLLMLCLGLVALLRLPFANRLKVALITAVLLLGLTGFFWKYASFFQKGATSVSARFDYWSAAIQTSRSRPLFGTGPGTFAIPYQKIKRPESEMARLVHNDYLEQASDSGLPGFVLYALFIVGTLVLSFPKRGLHETMPPQPDEVVGASRPPARASVYASGGRGEAAAEASDQDWLMFSVWLGLLGWSLQGLVEFGLYIPALAWPAFALMGWLLARSSNRIDKSQSAR